MPAIVVAGIPGEITLSDVRSAGGQVLLEPPLEIDEVGNAIKSLLIRSEYRPQKCSL